MSASISTAHRIPAEAARWKRTSMTHAVEIAGAPDDVLAYAATASRWPEWHPSSLKVFAEDRIAGAGTSFEEDIHAGGRPGHLAWHVDAYVPGVRWEAQARGDHGLWLRVRYDVQATRAGTTRFERRVDYILPGLFLALYNRLVGRRRVDRESALSLAQLKARCEARGPR